MSEEKKEMLSAYLDEELDRAEFERMNQLLLADRQMQARFNRYSIISETIKGNCGQCNAGGIVDAVSRSLDDEPVVLAPSAINKKRLAAWGKPLAGAAIAASVATLAFVNLSGLGSGGAEKEVFPVTVVDARPSVNSRFLLSGLGQQASTQWRSPSQTPEVEAELNRLMMDHSEYSSETGVTGMLPYASFVSYDQK